MMEQAMQVAEAAVKEFLLFRGFTRTLSAFDSDLHSDVGSGFQVGRILDLIFKEHVPSFEAEKLVNLLAFLSSLSAATTDVRLQQTAKQLERSLKRYYIVHALQRGRTDRVLEFFQQYGEGLLRSSDRDWLVWFAIPYMTNPGSDPNFQAYFSSEWLETLERSLRKFLSAIFEEIQLPAFLKFGLEESKCVALEKELEQMREVLNAKDEEIAYLRRDSPRQGSPRFKKVVPDYRVSPPVTHPKSPLSSGDSIEERENEADREAATKEEFYPASNSGDFSEAGKSPERISSPKWRPLSRRGSASRYSYSSGSEPERIEFGVSEAANSREKKKSEVSLVAIQHQETFSGHSSPITKCRYSATGANIASASADGTVSIWSPDVAATAPQNATICAGAEVLSLEWEHRSDRLLLLVRQSGILRLGTLRPSVLCIISPLKQCSHAASEIASLSGEGVDGLGYGSLTIWDMRTWKATTSLQLGLEPPVMTSACFNDNGKILAAGATDGKIRIFDLRESLPKVGWPAHATCAVSCVRIGHDQNSVFSLGADGKVFEWSLRNQGQVLHSVNASSYCALASGILPRHEFAIDSSARHVILTSNTTTAPMYQWGSSMTQKRLEHTAAITSVDWHPSSPMLLTGSADHSVRVTAVG